MKMSDIVKILEEIDNSSYPDAGKYASEEIQKLINEYNNLPEEERKDKPLLYYILGDGTPAYKMSKEDSEYVDESSNENTKCGNCEFAYMKVISEKYICSQIRGEIKPEAYCRLWIKGKK